MNVGDEVDRLGALPLHLRESILECMPIKDALRTSVLARKWRYCWTGMRKIDFNDFRMDRENVKVFRRAVDRVLLLHSGSITKFHLLVPVSRNHRNFNVSDWYHALSKKGVREIIFNACCCQPSDFPLPGSLFQCRDLVKLELYGFKITIPPTYKGFYNLVDLEIRYCKIPKDDLESLLSQCPVLEKLSLSSTCTYYIEPLVLNALHLRTFFYEDYLWGTIFLKNVPRLTYVSLLASDVRGIVEYVRPLTSWGFIFSLSLVNELVFDVRLLGALINNCPKNLPKILQNLKTLTLEAVDPSIEDDISFVLCLLRSSPGLQHLTLTLDSFNFRLTCLTEYEKIREAAQKLLETEAKEHSMLSNLITVAFEYITAFSHQIMLVKVFLSRCPNLKSLEFTPDIETTTEDVRMQLFKEFENFPNREKLI